MPTKERVISEAMGFKRITNEDMVCKNCIYCWDDSKIYGNSTKCDCFPIAKPNHVVDGGRCPYHKSKEE